MNKIFRWLVMSRIRRLTLLSLIVAALVSAAVCVSALQRPVDWCIDVAGRPYGIRTEPSLNAFGHQPDPQLEIRLGDLGIPLWRVRQPCGCSLCRAGLTKD